MFKYRLLVVITNGWKEIPKPEKGPSRLSSTTKGAKQNVNKRNNNKRRVFSIHQEL
jgi:hypothetical protein